MPATHVDVGGQEQSTAQQFEGTTTRTAHQPLVALDQTGPRWPRRKGKVGTAPSDTHSDSSTSVNLTSSDTSPRIAQGAAPQQQPPSRDVSPGSRREAFPKIFASTSSSSQPPLRSQPSVSTTTTSAAASVAPSVGSSSSTNPVAPVQVNPPSASGSMHLPSPRRTGPSSRRSTKTSTSSLTSAPAPDDFAFSNLLSDLLADPAAAADLDAIARICGRSKLSLANEYAAHRDPIGPGGGGEASVEAGAGGQAGTEERAQAGAGLGLSSPRPDDGVRVAGEDYGLDFEYSSLDTGDGSLHPGILQQQQQQQHAPSALAAAFGGNSWLETVAEQDAGSGRDTPSQSVAGQRSANVRPRSTARWPLLGGVFDGARGAGRGEPSTAATAIAAGATGRNGEPGGQAVGRLLRLAGAT